MLQDDIFRKIKAQGDIVRFLTSHNVILKKQATCYRARCPFPGHDDKNPSFLVYTHGRTGPHWYCPLCGGGDEVDFLMRSENLPKRSAAEAVAQFYGIEMTSDPAAEKKAIANDRLRAIMDLAARWFTNSLYQTDGEGAPALAYLRRRDVSDAEIAAWKIGFAPRSDKAWIGFRGQLLSQYNRQELLDSGLFCGTEGNPQPALKGRIVFPITDAQDRVIAFAGRASKADIERGEQKYINTRTTALFTKGLTVYGLAKARKAALESDSPVLVVEGYLDTIALHKHGYGPVVSCMGTAMTEHQMRQIWDIVPSARMTSSPVICLDGDKPGQKAAKSIACMMLPLLEPGLTATFALLPDGKDPADLMRTGEGQATFRDAVTQSSYLADLLWQNIVDQHDLDRPEACSSVSAVARDEILKPIKHQEIKADFARRLVILRDREFGRESSSCPVRYEKIMLAALINHPSMFPQAYEDLVRVTFSSRLLENWKSTIVSALSQCQTDEELSAAAASFRREADVRKVLLCPAVLDDAPFAKPDASPDAVAQGMTWVVQQIDRERMIAEMETAMRSVDMSDPAQVDRLRSLVDVVRKEVG